jgi:hypothetical protein
MYAYLQCGSRHLQLIFSLIAIKLCTFRLVVQSLPGLTMMAVNILLPSRRQQPSPVVALVS